MERGAAKKKVLIIDNSLYPTGALRSVLNVSRRLQENFTFCFAIDEKSRVGPYLEAEGYQVFLLPYQEIRKHPVALLKYLPALYRNARKLLTLVKQEGIDIVHVNDLFNQLGTALKILKPGLPVVYHVRLLASSYIGKLYRMFAALLKRYADRLICVSGAVMKDLGATPKARIIYDGMDTAEALSPWQGLRNPDKAHLLYLGNIVCGKGQQWGVEALARVIKEVPGVTMDFAGGVHSPADEQFREELEALAVQHGIAGSIRFTGAVGNVEEAVKGADIVVNLSESESFSMVCLEAMVYGVPLVASDCGGPRDITEGGTRAALVPNKDPEAAAEAILHMLRQPEAARQRASEAKVYAAEKYALHNAAGQLRQLYEELGRNL